jgi:hypothetical protein
MCHKYKLTLGLLGIVLAGALPGCQFDADPLLNTDATGGTGGTSDANSTGGIRGKSDVNGTGGSRETSPNVASLTGSYRVKFDSLEAHSNPGTVYDKSITESLADSLRVDIVQSDKDLHAVLAAPWQQPRTCDVERKTTRLVLHCPTSESTGNNFISWDERTAPWIDIELTLDSDGKPAGNVSAESAFNYLLGDIVMRVTTTGTGKVSTDNESPQARIEANTYLNLGWLPWQTITVSASEGLTKSSLSAILTKNDHLTWSIETAEKAPEFGAITAFGTITDWNASGTVIALNSLQKIQDLSGNTGIAQTDSGKIIDLGPAVESYQFDSMLQLVAAGETIELLTAETSQNLCETGGCLKLVGVVEDCSNPRGVIAGRLLGRKATTLNLRYRVILGQLRTDDVRKAIDFKSIFTVEIGAPGVDTVSRVSSESLTLIVGESTKWQTFSMPIPEKLQNGDVGFAINLHDGECRSVFYWGGPVTVLIDQIELK